MQDVLFRGLLLLVKIFVVMVTELCQVTFRCKKKDP